MIGGTKRMCEEFVLSNGLRVVAEPIENFPSVSVGLWIGAGSMYESASTSCSKARSAARRRTSPWRWTRWADR